MGLHDLFWPMSCDVLSGLGHQLLVPEPQSSYLPSAMVTGNFPDGGFSLNLDPMLDMKCE